MTDQITYQTVRAQVLAKEEQDLQAELTALETAGVSSYEIVEIMLQDFDQIGTNITNGIALFDSDLNETSQDLSKIQSDLNNIESYAEKNCVILVDDDGDPILDKDGHYQLSSSISVEEIQPMADELAADLQSFSNDVKTFKTDFPPSGDNADWSQVAQDCSATLNMIVTTINQYDPGIPNKPINTDADGNIVSINSASFAQTIAEMANAHFIANYETSHPYDPSKETKPTPDPLGDMLNGSNGAMGIDGLGTELRTDISEANNELNMDGEECKADFQSVTVFVQDMEKLFSTMVQNQITS